MYPWFKFYFPLFLGMVMYDRHDNEFKTKGTYTLLALLVKLQSLTKVVGTVEHLTALLIHFMGLISKFKNDYLSFS